MNAKVIWQQDLTFTGTADSGFSIPLGADKAVGGLNDGFRPMELLITGLAGCTAMDVISILQKKRQGVTAFEVQIHAERATEHPKVITGAVITYLVTGRNLDEAALIRAIELSATKYCPAQTMLIKVFPIELRYEIFKDEGRGKTRLLKSGQYPK
jgi:putative redox protein